MTLIDGDKLVTAQLYDDEHEEFKEEKMSIIDYVNAYTTEGVTTADDVLDKIRAEIEFEVDHRTNMLCAEDVLAILDKFQTESEG